MSGQITITKNDKARLKKLIHRELSDGPQNEKAFKKLNSELDKAKVVDAKELPKNVITMNSKVLVRLNGNEEEVTLVYPQDADLAENKISILSPVGTAILGYREGDTIEWEVPSGVMEIHILKVLYQPEASGDLDS